MLEDERIKEAETKVKIYLNDGLLRKKEPDDNIINILRKNSEESLEVADHLSNIDLSSLWVIVASYYSMYYIANAVLYKLGYKVGDQISHKITSDALIVYIRDKLKKSMLEDFEEAKDEASELINMKADEIIQNFDYERNKRSKFQYQMSDEIKKSKAETSLKRAKQFVFEMENLLLELQKR